MISLGPLDSPYSVWLPCENDEEAEEVARLASSLTDVPFRLFAFPIRDWDRDLSPWPAPGVFKGQSFSGGAPEFLGSVLKEVAANDPRDSSHRILGGYSLAGLFTLWGLYQTDAFGAGFSCSGSTWFPDFLDYAKSTSFPRKPRAVYLSLGDKESHAKNPTMKAVQACTDALFSYYKSLGIPTTFELNPGNHFVDAPLREAKGIAWILNALSKQDEGK